MTDESAVCNRKFVWASHLLIGHGFHDLQEEASSRISKSDEIIKSLFILFSFLNFIFLLHLIFVVLSNVETSPKMRVGCLSPKPFYNGMVVTVLSEKTSV